MLLLRVVGPLIAALADVVVDAALDVVADAVSVITDAAVNAVAVVAADFDLIFFSKATLPNFFQVRQV